MTSINKFIIKNLNMRLSLQKFIFLFALNVVLLSPANATTINAIDFISLPGSRVQIRLKMDKPLVEPKSFTIETPSRIVFDFLDTTSSLKRKVLPIGLGVAKSITTVQTKSRTRVVLNLSSLTTYKTNIDGNNFNIIVNAENTNLSEIKSVPSQSDEAVAIISGKNMSRFGEDDPNSEEVIQESFKGSRYLKNIDFRRGPNGEGRVILELSSANIPTNIKEENGSLVIDLLNTGLPARLKRRMDVLDFTTPIKSIDTEAKTKNVRITINTLHKDYEQLAYQTKNIFTIELKPLAKDKLEAKIKEKFGYTGEKLSLNFQDIEIRAVLQLLADFTNQNLVVSDTVTGKLTLRLKNVPWDHALDIILKTKALGMRKNGNVLLIAPTEEIAAREKLELEASLQVEELAPLKTRFIQVNYGKSSAMAQMINSDKGSILSARGSVTIDERTNTLIVRDTDEILTQIRTLVRKLDKPVRQVLIESRVVIAKESFGKDLGVRWGVNNSVGDTGIIAGNTTAGIDLATGAFKDTPTENRYAVNLPAANVSASRIALAVANLSKGTLLELELSALQEEGKGELVASPRIITSNQKEAIIENGIEIPYIVVSNGDATINYKKALLSLKVTPHITPDDRVILDIQVNKDAVGKYVTVGLSSVPTIQKREIKTQVLVNNGETIVLGGVYEESSLKNKKRTPFFSDLPLIGKLFESNQTSSEKNELLVFVTPKIVKDIASINY